MIGQIIGKNSAFYTKIVHKSLMALQESRFTIYCIYERRYLIAQRREKYEKSIINGNRFVRALLFAHRVQLV